MTVMVDGIVPDWTRSLTYDPRVIPIGMEMLIEHLNQIGLIEYDVQEVTFGEFAAGAELGRFLRENGVEWCLVQVRDELRRAPIELLDACLYAANLGSDRPAVFPLLDFGKEFLRRAEHSGGRTTVRQGDCSNPEIRLSRSAQLTLTGALLDRGGYTMVDYRLVTGGGTESERTTMGGIKSLVLSQRTKKK